MKYTELTITKKRRNEYLITIDVYESLDNYVHTIAKDFFIESLGDTIAYLNLLAEVDPAVRFHVESRGNLDRRFRAAKHGSLVFSIRWDGSYLERLPHEASNDDEYKEGQDSPANITWELVPFSFAVKEPVFHVPFIGWHVSWLHGHDWDVLSSNDGEVQ